MVTVGVREKEMHSNTNSPGRPQRTPDMRTVVAGFVFPSNHVLKTPVFGNLSARSHLKRG